ncbi:hypothetical protein FRC07_015139, partial [Ceratobasidium sp. 392]
MSEASNQGGSTPLFMKMFMGEVPVHLLEGPTEDTPEGVPQSLIDAFAEQHKAEGDKLYRDQKWEEARLAYMQGVRLRPSDPNVRKSTLLNLAATDLQLKNWNAVVCDACWILKMDPNSVKAFYRAARALSEIGLPEEALDCCNRALRFEPYNQPLRASVALSR